MSNQEQPQITIIVAVLNNADTLGRCLDSIIAQTYPNTELVVIDGGSTDGTLEILEQKDTEIAYWKSEPDTGIYNAWNKALDCIHGEWVCFLGADDYFWDDRVLAALNPYLVEAEASGIRVVYGRAAFMDTAGNVIKFIGKPWEKIGWLMPHGMPLPHPGLMHHRTIFEDHGGFDEAFPIAADYELLLRELKDRQALFAEGITVVGWQSGGVSDHQSRHAHREVAGARRKNGYHGISWIWVAVHLRDILRDYWRKFSHTKQRSGL